MDHRGSVDEGRRLRNAQALAMTVGKKFRRVCCSVWAGSAISPAMDRVNSGPYEVDSSQYARTKLLARSSKMETEDPHVEEADEPTVRVRRQRCDRCGVDMPAGGRVRLWMPSKLVEKTKEIKRTESRERKERAMSIPPQNEAADYAEASRVAPATGRVFGEDGWRGCRRGARDVGDTAEPLVRPPQSTSNSTRDETRIRICAERERLRRWVAVVVGRALDEALWRRRAGGVCEDGEDGTESVCELREQRNEEEKGAYQQILLVAARECGDAVMEGAQRSVQMWWSPSKIVVVAMKKAD
ncbi:hypothetical protein C8R45DRAFT_923079 [Mycena sanguinolenta]|nr:hypothetical protein C8R45DRAFT_923079 [Mycena sanguinolenta]